LDINLTAWVEDAIRAKAKTFIFFNLLKIKIKRKNSILRGFGVLGFWGYG
jgi:hypothetical protein